MKYVKDSLLILMYAAIITFFVLLSICAVEAIKVTKALPAEIKAENAVLLAEIDTTRNQLFALTDKHATIIERTADERLIAIQDLVNDKSDATLKLVDSRMGEITTPVAMAQANLYGAVQNLAELEKDIQNSLDDLYPDIKATTESTAVLVTSAAQASEAVRDAAPKIAASTEGVAADAKREADSLTAPKKWWQKVLGPAYTIGRLVALF